MFAEVVGPRIACTVPMMAWSRCGPTNFTRGDAPEIRSCAVSVPCTGRLLQAPAVTKGSTRKRDEPCHRPGDRRLPYTPDADVNGSDTFTFVVTAGARQSNQPIVTVTIVEANDPPVAAENAGDGNGDRKKGPKRGWLSRLCGNNI